MGLTAQEIAGIVGGELRGDPQTVVDAVAPLDRAGPRHVSFVASAKYAHRLGGSAAGVVLVPPDWADAATTETWPSARVVVVVDRPQEAMLLLLPQLYNTGPAQPWVAPTARIGRGARLGARVRIEDYVVIGDDVAIGDDTVLRSHVTLYPGTRLGSRCIIHSGVRLGSDGFGYVFRNGEHVRIPHVGGCIVGDDVEIGANSAIDRGSIDDTVIGDGSKIDNLVHIAHNVRIGRGCLVLAQVGIAGSTHIGDGVIVAGQAGIGGHARIGDGARIGAQAGVFGDVPAGESWSGYPARPHRESLRASAALFRLSGMMRRLSRLLDARDPA